MRPRDYLWFVLVATSLICGCSRVDGISSVSGKVTLDEKPLPQAIVVFQPVQGGRPASAITDETGQYTLNYTSRTEGALLGKHVVHIRTEMDSIEGRPPVREFLPARYHDKSELTAEVKEGSNEINFDLTSD